MIAKDVEMDVTVVLAGGGQQSLEPLLIDEQFGRHRRRLVSGHVQETVQLRPISKGKIDLLALNLFGEAGEVFRFGLNRIADVIRNAANLQKIKDVRSAIHAPGPERAFL